MRTEAQLRDVFNRTIDALPRKDRSLIEGFWRQNHIPSNGDGDSGRLHPPIFKDAVILARNMTPRGNDIGPQNTLSRPIAQGQELAELHQQSRRTYGRTDGLIFRFKSAVVDEAPDDILQILIAHELAHTFRAAEMKRPFPEAAIARGTSELEEEQAATSLSGGWGFNEGKLLQWLRANEAKLRL